MTRAALYIRVSTVDQNADLQRRELEAYAGRHQWEIVETYTDQASGAATRRPGVAALLAAARAGRFEIVLCWKLDRFGRSVTDCLNNLRTLDTENVRFLAITQGIDTDRNNPAARFFVTVLAAVAEFERELIRERAAAGLARYRQDLAAGKVGKTVFSKTGKNLPPSRPRRIVDVARILELKDQQHLTMKAIEQRTGLTRNTIYRRLREFKEREAAHA